MAPGCGVADTEEEAEDAETDVPAVVIGVPAREPW